MEPIDYAGALRRSWRLFVVLALLGAIIAVLIPVKHTKALKVAGLPYSATALVGTPPGATNSPLRAGVASVQILFFATKGTTEQAVSDASGVTPMATTAAIVTAPGVNVAGAGAALKRGVPTDVELTGYAATPAGAVQVANTYVYVVNQQVEAGLQADTKAAGLPTGFTIIASPTAASTNALAKSSLTGSRSVRGLGGLVAGVLVAAGIVLLRELLDKRLRSASRAEANFGFPVIVEIPTARLDATAPVPALVPVVDVIRDPLSPAAEAYRMLRMSVMFEPLAPLTGLNDPFALGFDTGDVAPLPEQTANPVVSMDLADRRVVLVASAGSEPTRPHVAANLAAIYAEARQRVIVMSTGDLGTVGGRGGTDEIRTEDVEAVLQPSRVEYVSRLPMGPFVANSGQLVDRAPALIEAARSLADLVIIEVPPLLAVHHAEALARAVDVVLVVAECRFTKFDDARQAGDLLRRMGAPVLGVVLTNIRIGPGDIRQSAFRPQDPEGEADGPDEPVPALDAAGSGADSQSRI